MKSKKVEVRYLIFVSIFITLLYVNAERLSWLRSSPRNSLQQIVTFASCCVNQPGCSKTRTCSDPNYAESDCSGSGGCTAFYDSAAGGWGAVKEGATDSGLSCSTVGSTTICIDQYGCTGTATCLSTGYWSLCSATESTVPACTGTATDCSTISSNTFT